jgi:hypothetical protein
MGGCKLITSVALEVGVDIPNIIPLRNSSKIYENLDSFFMKNTSLLD